MKWKRVSKKWSVVERAEDSKHASKNGSWYFDPSEVVNNLFKMRIDELLKSSFCLIVPYGKQHDWLKLCVSSRVGATNPITNKFIIKLNHFQKY